MHEGPAFAGPSEYIPWLKVVTCQQPLYPPRLLEYELGVHALCVVVFAVCLFDKTANLPFPFQVRRDCEPEPEVPDACINFQLSELGTLYFSPRLGGGGGREDDHRDH